ncbi:cytochrome b5-like heme/steroid binding domain-containing protein [Mycena maculata]|uniref:Cytochrome b5-like heme/steroid binding domain-containing protein n=1 Tax=Mycena maculata TaxID=230809 RepID=A0AAD7JEM7_9AGAR|nr:cytochrome b5-like heme/steroid binding domain-containing protein [Mycena maculata]
MSWMSGLTGQEPERYVAPLDEEKVADPSIPDRMVSAKAANQPFLAHKQYRDKQEALHNAWLEKKKIRDAKIAKGEPVGPLERDPTEPTEVGLLGLFKFFVYTIIFLALAGKFVTGSYTWEYETRWLQLKTLWPANIDQRLFSEELLSKYNGDGNPTYLAIDGDVYDVSKGKAYQPGGSYHFMTGIDAARAFGTGCFQTHKTHDLRGLSESEYAGVQHWKQFFANHKDYTKVGRVSHPPIDPASPIPEHCDKKKQAKAEEEGRVEAKRTQTKEPPQQPAKQNEKADGEL